MKKFIAKTVIFILLSYIVVVPTVSAESINIEEAYARKEVTVADLCSWSIQLANKGYYDDAISILNKVVQLEPDNTLGWIAFSAVYYEKGEYDKTINYANKSLQIDKNLSVGWYFLGSAYCQKGEYDKAIGYLNKALQLDKNLAMAWNNLGMAYVEKNEYDKAIGYLNKALQLDSNLAITWHNIGGVYLDKGEYDKSIGYLSRSLQLDKNNAITLNNLGISYLYKGQYDQAINYLNKALQLVKSKRDKAIIWSNLGYAYEDKGEYNRAAEAYSKAYAIVPNARYKQAIEKSFYNAANPNNYIDWSKVPKVSTKKELVTYIENGKKHMYEYVPVVLTNGLMINSSDLITLSPTSAVGYEIKGRNGNNINIIYRLRDYPGSRVAYAYLGGGNTFWLSEDEKNLYNLAIQIVKEANKKKTILEKELYIHDEIARRANYYTEKDLNNMPRFVTAIGALIDGKANCQGYSDAFYMLSTMCGLNVGRISGDAGGSHMWNVITFEDGISYCVDVTWDDAQNNVRHTYFNAPLDVMQKDHTWDKGVIQKWAKNIDSRYLK